MKTRRSFLKTVSGISAGIAATGIHPLMAGISATSSPAIPERKIYIFSKHLHWLTYEEMAETVKNVGFDGIDLTVRPNGHVLPEKVKEDLPKAVKAIKNAGLLANRMTTAIIDPDDPLTMDILKTAADLGLVNYRMGWYDYDSSMSVQDNIKLLNSKLIKLAALNKKFGLKAAYQNHNGESVGGPVWDIGLMLEGVDPEYIGVRYDIRHATVEGGKSWPVGMKFLSAKINSFDVKDFVWKETNNNWDPYNVPLGDGMVDFDRYLKIIKEFNIQGDFTIHLEYPIGGAEHGATELTDSPDLVIAAMNHDLKFMRNLLSE
ncbi:MAG: sugar phosphate isomerase/epimerase [Bacteroidales bacterium]|nr:sugar phosphate isomerase/epimerase [Bacteroidales bacterium]